MPARRTRTEADRVALFLSGIRSSSSRLHYAWVIVAVCFAVAVMTAGVRSTPGVLIVPLEDEFGWSRATISFALGVNLLLFGAIGPYAAAVMGRVGARRIITLALAVTAASVVVTPAMTHPWQLILLWRVVVGLSTGFVGGFLAAYIAGRWFRAREGFVVGLLTAANAAGQLVFLPTMASLVTHFGWRIMSLVLSGAVLAFLPLRALLMRNRPEDVGPPPGSAHIVAPLTRDQRLLHQSDRPQCRDDARLADAGFARDPPAAPRRRRQQELCGANDYVESAARGLSSLFLFNGLCQ